MTPLVYYATVTGTGDPLGLGRVQVKLRGFATEVDLADVWLRTLSPTAGKQTGFVFLPEVGDEVVVLRAAEDVLEGMLVLGAVYNAANKPIYSNKDGKNVTKEIRTRAGNAVTFTDTGGEEAIVISTANAKIKVSLSNAEGGAVTIEGADRVTIHARSELSIDARKVTISASDSLEIGGKRGVKVEGGKLELSGSEIDLSATGNVGISGRQVDIG